MFALISAKTQLLPGAVVRPAAIWKQCQTLNPVDRCLQIAHERNTSAAIRDLRQLSK